MPFEGTLHFTLIAIIRSNEIRAYKQEDDIRCVNVAVDRLSEILSRQLPVSDIGLDSGGGGHGGGGGHRGGSVDGDDRGGDGVSLLVVRCAYAHDDPIVGDLVVAADKRILLSDRMSRKTNTSAIRRYYRS
jgi:hypothetical protein